MLSVGWPMRNVKAEVLLVQQPPGEEWCITAPRFADPFMVQSSFPSPSETHESRRR
jgi:hypothetical protein